MTQNKLRLADIANDELMGLCEQIMSAYRRDSSSIEGTVLAYLAERLLAAEVQPGGPYMDTNGNITVTLNTTIGRLFILLGNPLPNIDTYLARASRKQLTKNDQEMIKKYESSKTEIYKTKQPAKRHLAYKRAEKTLEALAEPIRAQALQFLARVEAADVTGEIAAFAHFTNEALSAHVSVTKLHILGEANIHSWIAYTIYDHILDSEADASLLPAANVCMRLAFNLYKQSLPARHPLQALITEYFDQVDTMSAWELTFCRSNVHDGSIDVAQLPVYKQYENLAWRSCIHILGPIIVASTVLTPTKMDTFTKGLHHYLIARQLADDIHDWRDDLASGRMSATVTLLLMRQNIDPNTTHALKQLITGVQEDFLHGGALAICELILAHTHQARSHLASAGLNVDSTVLLLTQRLEHIAASSIDQQARFLEFKNAYHTST